MKDTMDRGDAHRFLSYIGSAVASGILAAVLFGITQLLAGF
jgi:hypothetical protein